MRAIYYFFPHQHRSYKPISFRYTKSHYEQTQKNINPFFSFPSTHEKGLWISAFTIVSIDFHANSRKELAAKELPQKRRRTVRKRAKQQGRHKYQFGVGPGMPCVNMKTSWAKNSRNDVLRPIWWLFNLYFCAQQAASRDLRTAEGAMRKPMRDIPRFTPLSTISASSGRRSNWSKRERGAFVGAK